MYLFLEGGEKREKERERNMDVQEIHLLVASRTPPAGDMACNPGMCPVWELSWRSLDSQAALKAVIHTNQA